MQPDVPARRREEWDRLVVVDRASLLRAGTGYAPNLLEGPRGRRAPMHLVATLAIGTVLAITAVNVWSLARAWRDAHR